MTGEGVFIDISSLVLAADHLTTSPTTWLCDTSASHHIRHRREFFTTLEPISGTFRIKQVQGTIDVTHHGTIMLQVDSATGKRQIKLSNVLLIKSMQFNILSLQKVLATGYIYTFNLITGKVVVQKQLPTGAMEQVALFTKSKLGRLTLDCTMTTLLPVLPSTSQA